MTRRKTSLFCSTDMVKLLSECTQEMNAYASYLPAAQPRSGCAPSFCGRSWSSWNQCNAERRRRHRGKPPYAGWVAHRGRLWVAVGEARFHREDRDLGAGAEVQFGEDVRDVALDS